MFKWKRNDYKSFIKNHSLSGTLLIVFLILIVLSWIIRPGYLESGVVVVSDTIKPLGIFDIFRTPLATVVNVGHYIFFILLLGGLYGVLNETEGYEGLVKKVAKKMGSKVITITTLFFIIMSTLTGNLVLLFVLVPFFLSVILVSKYDKITALAATIGAILIGNIISVFGSAYTSAVVYYYDIGLAIHLVERLIIIALFSTLYILWINKRKNDKKKEEIPLLVISKTKEKKELVNILGFVSIIFLAFLFFVMYDWYYVFEIESIKNLSINIMENDFLAKVFGSFNLFGSWSLYDMTVMIVMYIFIIVFVFKIKLAEAYKGFVWGARQMIRPAILVAFTFIAYYAIIVFQGDTNIYYTIVGYFFSLFAKFEIIAFALSSFVGALFFNNMGEMIYISTQFAEASHYATNPVLMMVVNLFYGVGLLLVPTSIFLIAGLSLLGISYYRWLQYIYKLLFIIMAVGLVLFWMMYSL